MHGPEAGRHTTRLCKFCYRVQTSISTKRIPLAWLPTFRGQPDHYCHSSSVSTVLTAGGQIRLQITPAAAQITVLWGMYMYVLFLNT